MNQKEITKTFMMISIWKKPFGLHFFLQQETCGSEHYWELFFAPDWSWYIKAMGHACKTVIKTNIYFPPVTTLGHTNLFNCFTESPPKISENDKKKIEISKFNLYFFRHRGFIHFKVQKKRILFLFYCADAINSHYFRCKQNWRCGQSDTTQRAARFWHQVWKIADRSRLTLCTLWFC